MYEAMLQILAPQQIKLLSALSEEPTDKPYSTEYMNRYNLGSIGGVQGAIRRLIDLDYIEKKNGVLHVVDTVFGIWLRHLTHLIHKFPGCRGFCRFCVLWRR